MNTTKSLLGILLALTVIFSGCSKEDEEDELITVQETKSLLSFNVLLNDLAGYRQSKQMNPDYRACPEGEPVFVEIIITIGNVYIAGSEKKPQRINLKSNSQDLNGDGLKDYFTDAAGAIELEAGTYSLEYFTVLDADENVLWIAPMNDNEREGPDNMVSKSLPMNIRLGEGEKKLQDVEVICFDDRNINEYGYFFYNLNGIQVIEFCLFGNYCYESGRHAEFILYEVDVWKYSGNPWTPKGTLLQEDLQNEVVVIDYEDYAETQSFPLCLTLPDGPGNDEYYMEITQVNLGEENVLIRSGLISDEDVRSLFNEDGTMEYLHFTEGECDISDDPALLNDPGDIIGAWEFTFIFGGDAVVAADVVFYSDGTATHQLYGDPDATIWGTWAYYDGKIFYDPDGEEDVLGFDNLSGTFTGGRLSGDFYNDGYQEEWSAVRKD